MKISTEIGKVKEMRNAEMMLIYRILSNDLYLLKG